ncbi:MAG: sulfotransferase family protein, partial [Rubrobacter sp.]
MGAGRDDRMTMPNFFVVGAQKAGTTSLYHYLDQHPQVYMSFIKEPFFFDHELDPNGEVVPHEFGGHNQAAKFANLEEYGTLFRAVKDETAIGEATPLYIYAPGTAERIERFVPGAKAIALLRNPADRAYSAFQHAVRIGVEPLTDFAEALRVEEERIRDGWHYIFHYRNRGLYCEQLESYYEVFGRERVGVWLYEDLRDDPARVAQSVFRFLGVDDAFTPD